MGWIIPDLNFNWNIKAEKLHYIIKIHLIFHLSINKYSYTQHKDFVVYLFLVVVVDAHSSV